MRKIRSDKGKKRGPYKQSKIQSKTTITNRDKAISILEKAQRKLENRLIYNLNALKHEQSHFRMKKTEPIRNELMMIEAGIKELKEHKWRPREKAIEFFEDIWTINDMFASGYEDLKFKVNDRESNFKRMILEQLSKQGVNIYNPTELYKLFEGYSLDDIAEAYVFANVGEEETFYDVVTEDVVSVIKDIINGLKEEERLTINQVKNSFI